MDAGQKFGLGGKKVSAIKELCEAERQSSDLPQTIRTTIDDVVRERLEADHMLAQFDRALSVRGLAILQSVATPEEWETMTRGRRNMAPAREAQTTVNVTQQQAQGVSMAPRDALAEILKQEGIGAEVVQSPHA